MIGSNKRKNSHNKQPRFHEDLKKESRAQDFIVSRWVPPSACLYSSAFEWHLINKLKRRGSGSHSQESVSKTKWQRLLKATFHDWLKQAKRLSWQTVTIPRRAKKRKSQDFIVSSWVPRKPSFTRSFLNTTWMSKRCSVISVKKCLARCVPTYLPIQNSCHAYTVSVCTAWNNGIERAMAATRSDARNVKPLAEYLKVAILKIFQPVFIWMAWLMCWQ